MEPVSERPHNGCTSNDVTRSVFIRSWVFRGLLALAPVASDCGARTELSAPALPDVVDETDGGPMDVSNPLVDALAWCSNVLRSGFRLRRRGRPLDT